MGFQESVESVKSTMAGLPETAREAARSGGKGLTRGASMLRQSATDHPYLSAAVGLALAGVGLAALRGSGRQRRMEKLAAGLAIAATALSKASRGKAVSRGIEGATAVGKGLQKWGRNQSLGAFAKENVGPLLRQLLPLLGLRLLKGRRRFI